jgi:hypothetical protein
MTGEKRVDPNGFGQEMDAINATTSCGELHPENKDTSETKMVLAQITIATVKR